MTETFSVEQAQRIVALISQAQSDRLEMELLPFAETFHDLAEKLAAILQGLTSGPVKCSVSRFSISSVDPAETPAHGSGFRSPRGDMAIYLKSERSFDGLLCDLCFGGSGMELHGDDEKVRPASKIEILLRGMVFDGLHNALPDIFNRNSGIAMEARDIDPQIERPANQQRVKCVMAVILVNVFSLSAEVEVMLPLAQLETYLGSSCIKSVDGTRSMRDVLAACPFEVLVSLPQQEVSLSNILNLEVGSLLKLQATPIHPSMLQIEGVPIGRGRLDISTSHIGVSIL